MSRKTVNVSDIKDLANHLLFSNDVSQEVKKGVSELLEGVLHLSGNYEGFRYLYLEKNDNGDLNPSQNSEYSRCYF